MEKVFREYEIIKTYILFFFIINLTYVCFILLLYSWICFSQLPYLPEMDALQSDIKIINQCYQHLTKTKQSDDLAYIDAYKYTFSRTGKCHLLHSCNKL